MTIDLTELLDPQLKAPLKKMLEETPPMMNFDDMPAARALSKEQMAKRKGPMPDVPGVVTKDYMIPGPEGAPEVMVRVYRPAKQNGKLAGFLWIHGGGYIMGDVESQDFSAKRYSLVCNAVVVSVDYRLAPECPYPGPLEDCYAALKWMAENPDEIQIDADRIAIGGGSAGGGLAAGLALLARDRGEVNIIYQMLVYPMINDYNTFPASDTVQDALFWTRFHNLKGWSYYLGCEPGGDDIEHYAAAHRATDLAGLPPAYIAVGGLDLFAEEDVEYARKLIAAGVPTELHVYPGAPHAFDGLVPDADISRRFTGDILRALTRVLNNRISEAGI